MKISPKSRTLLIASASALALAGSSNADTIQFDYNIEDFGDAAANVVTEVFSLPEVASINSVSIELSHSYAGDILFSLAGPDGDVYSFFNGSGAAVDFGNGTEFLSGLETYTFVDVGGAAGFPSFDVNPVPGGTYLALAWGDGSAAGDWTLTLDDRFNADDGAIGSIVIDYTLSSDVVPVPAELVARQWNEALLEAVRLSFPDPPVTARNCFHASVAMYDAWAAYDSVATGYFHREDATAADLEAARHEAISYAAFRVLVHRYTTVRHPNTPLINSTLAEGIFNRLMRSLGYDPLVTTTVGDTPAAVGNRVAQTIISWTGNDNSNEVSGYTDLTYSEVNGPLDLEASGTVMADPNRWQPLEFVTALSQNGQPLDFTVQGFLGAHWRTVWPFALSRNSPDEVYLDPGPPPLLGDPSGSRDFQDGNVEVIRYSSLLDPSAAPMIDISPASLGNNTLGFNDGTGYDLNPATGAPYAPNMVNEADFGRVIAEYWADGPESETPPGHWNVIANEMVDHPSFERRWGGTGPLIDVLEWDVKMYFLLNAAVHDAAVACWNCKREYDYVRPISSIRYLAQLGQSSDPDGLAYHPDGLPLIPDLIEVATKDTTSPGGRHAELGSGARGKIVIWAWKGEPTFPEVQFGGVGWILAEDWFPYQRATFVTPAFAGYVSGHSTFSRAAAEVLTTLTGSPYFPGGLHEYVVPAGDLEFEAGPSTDVTLQWATYFDAADQAGISRIYGGIHVPADDGPGRIIGSLCGKGVWDLGVKYFDGSILEESFLVDISAGGSGVRLEWPQRRGLFYRVEQGSSNGEFIPMFDFFRAEDDKGSLNIPGGGATKGIFRVRQSASGE